MNYITHYDRLIDKARFRTSIEGYTEIHHILPLSLGGTDDKCNLVKLTAREHFIAHLLLVKIYPLSYSMIKALNMMCCTGKGTDRSMNRMYGWLKEKHSNMQSEKMSGIGNTQFNTMWIYNLELEESKKIHKNANIPTGWIKGRVVNFDIKKYGHPKQNCKKCGDTVCVRSDICKKSQMINTLIKYFGFDIASLGSIKFYEEYDRVKINLETEYYGGLSTIDLVKKYEISSTQRLDSIFKSLGIKPKTLSDALKNYKHKSLV